MDSAAKYPILAALALLALAGCRREEPEYVTIPPYYEYSLEGVVEGNMMNLSEEFPMFLGSYCFNRHNDPDLDVSAHNSYAEVHMSVLPIYAFGQSSGSGDYYAVNGYVLTHNADMYERHRKIDYDDGGYRHDWEICANFMRDLTFSATLLDGDGQPLKDDVRFEKYPTPETTIGSTSYTSGWKVTLGFAVQIGGADVRDPEAEAKPKWWKFITGKLMPKFDYTTTDSIERQLPDQSVEQYSSTDGSHVEFHFLTNNYDHRRGDDIPLVAKDDERCYFSWVWYLPHGSNGVGDNSEKTFRIELGVDAKMGINEFDESIEELYDYTERNACGRFRSIPLPEISRIPVGNVTLMNLTSYYIHDLRVTLPDYDEQPLCYGDPEIYGKNQTAEMTLHEGRYDIWFDLVDGNTSVVKRRCVIRDVSLKADETVTLSTLDARNVDSNGRIMSR